MSTDEAQAQSQGAGVMLADLANAMVSLHKQQFGRGPTAARANHSGQDGIVVTMQGGLLPAERSLVDLGECMRVQEGRLFFQEATRDLFIAAAEMIVGRKVVAFGSACDPRTETVWELFEFESQ